MGGAIQNLGGPIDLIRTRIDSNRAVGGDGGDPGPGGGRGGDGGHGRGGGIYNDAFSFDHTAFAATANLTGVDVVSNRAVGGLGPDGGRGGDGQGGGLFNGGAGSMLTIHGGRIIRGRAVAGSGSTGVRGRGQGGGVYVDPGGLAHMSGGPRITRNHASDDGDDVFGDLLDG
jgi:hypothetical protein